MEKYRCSICRKKTFTYSCDTCDRRVCDDDDCQNSFIIFIDKESQIINFGTNDDYEVISECVYCTKDQKKMKYNLRNKQ